MTWRAGRALVVAAVFLGLVGTARAHEVGSAHLDLPVAFPVVVAIGTLPVIATAVALVVSADIGPNHRSVPLVELPMAPVGWGRVVLRATALVAIAATVGLGLFAGPGNPAPTIVWVLGLHGLAAVAILVGDPWPTISPWRSIYAGLCRVEGAPIALRPYPEWLGTWPALVGFVGGVGLVGTVSTVPTSARLTAVAVTLYGGTMIVGAIVFGPAWLDRADPLAVFYHLLGRVSPFASRSSHEMVQVVLRAPWATDLRLRERADGLVVVAAATTIVIDGLASARGVASGTTTSGLVPTGLGGRGAVLYLAAILLTVSVFGVTAAVAVRIARAGAGRQGAENGPSPVRTLGPVGVPIVAALELAHGGPSVLTAGGLLLGLGDPLQVIPVAGLWATVTGLVVIGHVMAQVLAHRIVRSPGGAGHARDPSLVPVTGLVVVSAAVSIWVIARPFLG